ncbi:MAG: multiheme c-type cytochrome, partial [Candidatus Promineifilaceae bacterium]|nr:multiheme c-type cytochrome [Candidatus Promineifilaceae bacterium]
MRAKKPILAITVSIISLVALLIGFGLPPVYQPVAAQSPALEPELKLQDPLPVEPQPESVDSVEPHAATWTPLAVAEDPLLRMPGTQPDQGVVLNGPSQCTNCHDDYGDPLTEPVSNWQGSMMAQSARDFLYWATLTVAAQDAIWAVGNPNATDLCLRCHMPGGWLGGRSDPTNGSQMTGIDFDGVQCNACHYLYDPFFETTYAGTREGNDWSGYWDETNASKTPSDAAALETYNLDVDLAQALTTFSGQPYYGADNLPPLTYDENGSGQMYVSTLDNNRRASFADANASHNVYYSRYHKSKYFCSTCHDISNTVLHNLGHEGEDPLPSETDPAYSYYHVERTFSEFMLSDYGLQGGADGLGPYAPGVFDTSRPGDKIATCQDCHMQDVPGRAAAQNKAILRPDESVEHPKSGVPRHDLSGGNMWVSYILASAVSGSPNYDATNESLLNGKASTLTLDLTAGDIFRPDYLLDGVNRAQQTLQNAAAIEDVNYDSASGALSFRVQNQTGHKLISGYPEGRRMFLNIRFYDDGVLIREINPYDPAAGTLKGLSGYTYSDPDGILPDPLALAGHESYVDELVYEVHNSSELTGEEESFHFVLGTDRYKDNRIPPKGFRIDEAAGRLSEP